MDLLRRYSETCFGNLETGTFVRMTKSCIFFKENFSIHYMGYNPFMVPVEIRQSVGVLIIFPIQIKVKTQLLPYLF